MLNRIQIKQHTQGKPVAVFLWLITFVSTYSYPIRSDMFFGQHRLPVLAVLAQQESQQIACILCKQPKNTACSLLTLFFLWRVDMAQTNASNVYWKSRDNTNPQQDSSKTTNMQQENAKCQHLHQNTMLRIIYLQSQQDWYRTGHRSRKQKAKNILLQKQEMLTCTKELLCSNQKIGPLWNYDDTVGKTVSG
jgi:hypothetical protein